MKNILTIALFFCIIHLNKSVFAFVPSGRGKHSAVLVNKKLYFLGGWDVNSNRYARSQLFYLDVSKAFTIVDKRLMPWNDLSSIQGITYRTGATACVDEAIIYYIGGLHTGGIISKFDTISQQWYEPVTHGSIPTPISDKSWQDVQGVALGHNIYIYGGFGVGKMNIFNTSQLYWSTFSSTLIFSGMQGYSATLLNNLILYIGGGFYSPYKCHINSNNEV